MFKKNMERSKNITVIKVGSSSVTNKEVGLNIATIDSIARQTTKLWHEGHGIVIVLSGAVAAGRERLGRVNGTTREKQVLAIFGQPRLMRVCLDVFDNYDVPAGQALFTGDDLKNPQYPLLDSLEWGIPIVNANDPSNNVEMKQYEKARDNDQLAGHLTEAMDARRLILLTNERGILNREDQVIENITGQEAVDRIEFREKSDEGTGGMESKVEVAWRMALQGRHSWIAKADEMDVILRIMRGEKVGTHVYLPV